MRIEKLHPADVPPADANLAYQVGAVPDVSG